MPMPIYTTFQGLPSSPALETAIERHARRLERFAPRLTGCNVTVRRSEDRHNKGNRYQVRVSVTLPGGSLEASRNAEPDHSHEDPYVAVRDAFDALRSQLEGFVEIRRGDVKAHTRQSSPS